MNRPCVYIMASRPNGTLYTGVTSNLGRRAREHRTGAVAGFTSHYGCKTLVWFEPHERMIEAIEREKQIKRRLAFGEDQADRAIEPCVARSVRGAKCLNASRRR